MPVTRANVEATKAFIRARLGNRYVYGGALSENVKQGTDCSEVWQTVLEMAHGRWRQGRQSEGATTESYRYIPVGGVGPFGTIRVANWRDIPTNAAARLAFHHGPGGGANSHMWGELDGMRIESGGSKGLVTAPQALAVDNPYATAWAYLPGPIEGAAAPAPPPPPAPSKADQYALAIIAEGRRRGITPRGIQIALSVVFVESNWKMYANSKVPESLRLPHDAVGSDHDSVGLFQQRCPMWGPAWVLMDPARSAGLFYDRLVKMDYNNTARSPGSYAADIQRPAAQYRYRYDERFVDAVMLYQRLAGVTPPPISGEDDFLSALTPDEQRALFNAIMTLFNAIMTPRRSRSPLRHLNEGTVGDTPDQVWDMDGSIHILVVYLLAKLKYPDPDAMALLREVADMDVAVNPGRERDRRLARAILADLDEQTAQPAGARVPAVYVAPEPEVLPAVHEPTPAQPQQQGTVNTPEALLAELDRLKTFDTEYRKRFDQLTVKDDDDSTGSHAL